MKTQILFLFPTVPLECIQWYSFPIILKESWAGPGVSAYSLGLDSSPLTLVNTLSFCLEAGMSRRM